MNFSQCWGLDATGNWQNFRQDDTGLGVWDLIQGRTENPVNEITALSTSVGASWVAPSYNLAGNMTTLPRPGAPTLRYTATYDAWNHLTKMAANSVTVAQYAYDGLGRRTVKLTYTGGILSETRDFYYSDPSRWQVLEERVSGVVNRQYVWGMRYQDDLVLRDRDVTGMGVLTERLYGLQDPNWNLTALADVTGTVQERYCYDAYGVPTFLTPLFEARSTSAYAWDVLYAGYRWDVETELYHVRWRMYSAILGSWLQRDPLGISAGMNLYQYAANAPLTLTDPFGVIPPLLFLLLIPLLAGIATGAVTYRATGNVGKAIDYGFTAFVITGLVILTAGTIGGAIGGTYAATATPVSALATTGAISFSIAAAEVAAQAIATGTVLCLAFAAAQSSLGRTCTNISMNAVSCFYKCHDGTHYEFKHGGILICPRCLVNP
jgi:RHS repeat-associated protein